MGEPVTITTMKKPLLAVLALAAVALVAVVIFENMPERRMDRRLDRLLRLYEAEPKQFCQRVVDDRDLLGFSLVNSFLACRGLERCSCRARASSAFPFVGHEQGCDSTAYLKQRVELLDGCSTQFEAEFCDCGRAPTPLLLYTTTEEGAVVFYGHPEDCNLMRASRDMKKTWGPYILRKTKEFREAWLNR